MNYMVRPDETQRSVRYRYLGAQSTIPSGRYRPRKEDYVTRFYDLLRKWQSETKHLSSPEEIRKNAAYRSLKGLGRIIVPLAIDELSREPSMLVMLLAEITGEQPFSRAQRGDLRAMTDAWLHWGKNL